MGLEACRHNWRVSADWMVLAKTDSLDRLHKAFAPNMTLISRRPAWRLGKSILARYIADR
jgi:hypothetical protein